jgi:transketolase
MSKNIELKAADNMRILCATMVENAKSGHPGGAMGGADFVHTLYNDFLMYDPSDMAWPHRDRFFLDPGHMSPMLYAILALVGTISMEDLKNFRQWGSPTPGHPEVDTARGIEKHLRTIGSGACNGCWGSHHRALPCGAIWRLDGAQNLCVYF